MNEMGSLRGKFRSAHRAKVYGKPDAKGMLWGYGTIASFNRWTHQPHEHRREIARNRRRAAKVA